MIGDVVQAAILESQRERPHAIILRPAEYDELVENLRRWWGDLDANLPDLEVRPDKILLYGVEIRRWEAA